MAHIVQKRRNGSNKETLAKLMAREGIAVIYDSKQKTASFNTKSRVLTLPIMMGSEEYVYDWFIAHEVSHALHTPNSDAFFNNFKDNKMLAAYFNVTEDARIEKLIKLKYPGTKKDCRKFYEHFSDPEVDFFQLKDKNIDEMSLIDRINLHFKIGHIIPINFTQEEQVYVDMVDSAMTAEASLEAAKKILEREQRNKTNKPQQSQQNIKIKIKVKTNKSSGGSDEEEDESDSNSGEDNQEDNQESKGDEEDDNLENDDSDNQEDSQDSKDDEEDIEIEIDLTEPETQKAFDEAMENLFGKNPQSNVSNTDHNTKSIQNFIDKMNEDSKRFQYNATNTTRFVHYNALMSSGKPIINMLVSYFNMKKKASEYQKIKQSPTGKINLDKIYQYKYNDDIFLRNDVVAEAKNHGLFFLIDWSYSMSSRISDTFKQLVLLIEFCRRVGIPYEVYAFTSDSGRGIIPDNISQNNIIGSSEGVKLVRVLDSSMNKKDHMKACETAILTPHAVATMSSTPICGSLMVCQELVQKFQNKYNCEKTIFCILTDGGTSDYITSSGNAYSGPSIIIDKYRNKYKSNNSNEDWKILTEYMKNSCNLHSAVGFYLCDNNDVQRNGISYSFLNSSKNLKTYAELMKRDGYFETDEVLGYDRYFFIMSSKLSAFLKNISDDQFKHLSEMSNTKDIEDAFNSNINNKSLKNLAFLKVFIEQIS